MIMVILMGIMVVVVFYNFSGLLKKNNTININFKLYVLYIYIFNLITTLLYILKKNIILIYYLLFIIYIKLNIFYFILY